MFRSINSVQKSENSLLRLWWHISPRRRAQFVIVLLLIVLASFAELLTIGAVLPFLMALSEPLRLFEYPLVQPFVNFLGIKDQQMLMLYMTIGFGGAAVLAGMLRVLLLWANTRLSYATGADLGYDIYKRTLYQPYSVHISRNSSQVISGVTIKLNQVVVNVIGAGLTLLSSLIILVAILVGLLMVSNSLAILSIIGFGFTYAIIIWLTRKRLLTNSYHGAKELNAVIKALQEGLGGIRDVLIDGSQDIYCKIFRDSDVRMRQAQANTAFISVSPRHVVEPAGMVLIAVIAYSLALQEDGMVGALPLLGAMALGAQRMLPVLQQGYGAWSQIRGSEASLTDTLALLDQSLPDFADLQYLTPIPFERDLVLAGVCFRYTSETPMVLRDVNLRIAKGDRVGFIGETGSGKSTLLDLIMGLLVPVSGEFSVDGACIDSNGCRPWQLHIAHVPQSIFLADSSIAENIAFGCSSDKIDMNRVRSAARKAQLEDLIESWPEQYTTKVGERGIRLSGGQRQRIGIARALYKRADVIIFDEATSALDCKTEEAVMRAIDNLSEDLTLLIIAHRLETLKNCDKIVELRNGQIYRISSYSEIEQ